MPVWVGYLAIGNVDQAVEQFKALSNRENKYANGKEENLIRFLSWQQKDKPLDAVAIYEEFKKKIGADELRKFFTQSALGAEWARERKVAQDLYFVGHSLGAALSQAAFYHFGPDSGRIPLAGCNFECYCFDPPGGITQEQGQKFLEFGRAHRELLRALNQKWGIHYQFEYQDFVPQGGPAWLGVAKESESDADWLDLTATLFKPKSTAKDLDITTLPTHGRRFLHIPKEIAKREYQVIPLNAQELYAFKSSVWLPLELRKKFGYHISTPLLTEKLRKNIGGSVIFALLWMKKKWEDWKNQDEEPDTDVSGVTYYSVDHPNLSKQENNLSI
jgi:hypothetical protein